MWYLVVSIPDLCTLTCFTYLPTEKFCFLLCRLLIFFKINFFKTFFQKYHQIVKHLDPEQAGHVVRPDLGPNCLQRLSADDTGSRVKENKGNTDIHLLYTLQFNFSSSRQMCY